MSRADEDLHRESIELWERKAAFWDERMGDGNRWYRELVAPVAEELLDVRPGERVLDLACGNGVFARRLATLGARVSACDASATFIERAKTREGKGAAIDYRVVDATDEAALLALGVGAFDAIVCNMALHDISDIRPLARAASQMLTVRGRFVFTIPHPAFNFSDGMEMASRENGATAVTVWNYLRTTPVTSTGMIGEPSPHYDFHRPISELLETFFRAGFVLDALREPAFARSDTSGADASWASAPDLPPVMAGRLLLSR
jgi:2-polyprenyl-3-methyl-5-hydroxy-6-metoxy-1,4-benzoquinol methylase